MRPFGRNKESDLEARLHRERPEPSPEFLASVEDRVSSSGTVRRRNSRLRYGLAAGFAASLVVVFGAFGGLGTFSTQSTQTAASSRVTISVPAKAVPALRALQAKGAILAASSVTVTNADLKAGNVKGIVLQPSTPAAKTAVSKAAPRKSGLKLAPVDKTVRTNLVPSNVGRNVAVIRLAANVVYVPGVFIPICFPVVIGPTTYYYSTLWPITSPLPPGATIGFCTGPLL